MNVRPATDYLQTLDATANRITNEIATCYADQIETKGDIVWYLDEHDGIENERLYQKVYDILVKRFGY